ncbi:hypothetical protein M0812_01919 [Anaeramoeba flamelloides]|uniref:Uncharacterized protein n=1 Tax=Anaeramoeba flamelloides TaxID=1746091 RepID=A0AAV7YYA5_9EUKA|nr:hypothetical protein M0812_01919 [Anaeramoeba flamelloides]
MSFPSDIYELFNGDLSQYDSNDFSEMNTVFQRDYNRSPSLDRSTLDQELTTSSSDQKGNNSNNEDKTEKNNRQKNGNTKGNSNLKGQLKKRFQFLTTDLEISNKENKSEKDLDFEQKQKQKQKQLQLQLQQQQIQQRRNVYSNNLEQSRNQSGTSKYGTNVRSKFRKRDLKNPIKELENEEELNLNYGFRENSTIVESGKDVYKLITGVLWVMSGGASIKVLAPYSDTITKKIGELLNASENEEKTFKKQLKYLLTNSRRTFTEYVLEIIIGVLSLRFVSVSEEQNDISVQFWDTLTRIVEIDEALQKIEQNQNSNENEKMQQLKEKEELQLNLQKIYKKIFTPKILMFWFKKRFVDRLDAFFGPKLADSFYTEHFFYFGKSKFMLSCLILACELVKKDGIAKRYSELVDLEYENDPLNLYSNNRGKKQGLIKELIVKYQLNGGQYWKVLSREYMKQLKFDDSNLLDFFPFKQIISNPLFKNLSNGYGQQMLTQKKRVLATKGNVIDNDFNFGWIMKKEN